MKQRELLRLLERNGCCLLREGSEHSIWENTENKRRTSVPRHREVIEFTVKAICKQLDIANPFENKN
jgi:mRNA interferase HicA